MASRTCVSSADCMVSLGQGQEARAWVLGISQQRITSGEPGLDEPGRQKYRGEEKYKCGLLPHRDLAHIHNYPWEGEFVGAGSLHYPWLHPMINTVQLSTHPFVDILSDSSPQNSSWYTKTWLGKLLPLWVRDTTSTAWSAPLGLAPKCYKKPIKSMTE